MHRHNPVHIPCSSYVRDIERYKKDNLLHVNCRKEEKRKVSINWPSIFSSRARKMAISHPPIAHATAAPTDITTITTATTTIEINHSRMQLTSVTVFRRHCDGFSLSNSGQRKQVEKERQNMTRKSRPGCRGCRLVSLRLSRAGDRTMGIQICEVCSGARLALTPNGVLSERIRKG